MTVQETETVEDKKYVPVFFDIETTGLNPMAQHWWNNTQHAARVTAVGIGTCEGWREAGSHEDAEYAVKVLYDSSEYNLLSVLRDRMETIVQDIDNDGGVPFLVGFNSRNFDHPYLGARYARLRQNGSMFNHSLKRLDMMRALGKHFDDVKRYPSETLCLEAVGIESNDPFDGSDMPQAYADKRWGDIETHVRHDVADMMRLFVETRNMCMMEFYDHYDINRDANFAEVYEP